MSKAYLLDTDAVIALNRGDEALQKLIDEAEEVYVSVITMGELYFGAEKSSRVIDNMDRLEQLADKYPVLGSDIDTAREYGRILYLLKLKGRPLPQNDIWIAALAQHHVLTVLTRDTHFKEIDGLSVAKEAIT